MTLCLVKGISREGSLLDVGVDHGIVRKAGAWFTYDEVQLGQGKENSKRFLRENADIALQLETDVYKAVGLIESESNEDISEEETEDTTSCLLYTSPSPRDQRGSRMPSSA